MKHNPFVFYASYNEDLVRETWRRKPLPNDMVETEFRCPDGHVWSTINSIADGSPALLRKVFVRCKECDFNCFVYLAGNP